ncbi:uridylate kinase [Methanosalsum zhilinae DSM 4017]|uniref:Uridylate kinase n=1 Tax=Methanosalsum zhilinae (strain DSM 4017 / NBRC 107636 / OCM 62 / WeN5) TaxID=679901 RepID=F7XKU6_METZD|nr:UMP kinase [Methanosalsum zhilinae]AEH61812.1 uridylate kinase [Methanosalsum zhilinae DSM 4017]
MLVVISIGGSILARDLNPERFAQYADALERISQEHEVVVVTGGGAAAREYIKAAREIGANEVVCDYVGIEITRLNAHLLIASLGKEAYPQPPSTYREAENALSSGKIVVMGGVIPGQTTDAVSAILAEYLGADLLVIATSVDGVYSSDPGTDPGAVRFEKMTAKELIEVVMSVEMKAGSKSPVDPLAAKMIERCNIETIVMDAKDPRNLIDVIFQRNLKTEPLDRIQKGTIIIG